WGGRHPGKYIVVKLLHLLHFRLECGIRTSLIDILTSNTDILTPDTVILTSYTDILTSSIVNRGSEIEHRKS
ncbi:MAG: hypothetical protein J4G05_03150, partial [Chlorobi bacterium]|nr:hypothetical protein [Chlorobiota bacterium]